MNTQGERIHGYLKDFDKVADIVLALHLESPNVKYPIRYNLASTLQLQIFSVVKSILKLTKITADVSLLAADENAQALIGLTRVLTESCNKFFYLVIDSENETELKRRFAYYNLVGARTYRKLLQTVGVDEQTTLTSDELVRKSEQSWLAADPLNWTPFSSLPDNTEKEAKYKESVLKGRTREDYITSHFFSAVDRRINAEEKVHYQLLGNIAIHSSSFLLFAHEPDFSEKPTFLTGLVSFALFNAARHLSLHGLEVLNQLPDLKDRISLEAGADMTQLARGIKQKDYLYV